MKKFISLCLFVCLTMCWQHSSACSCIPAWMCRENILKKDIVFVGRVMRIDEMSDWRKVVYFRVTKVWKGDLGKVVVVSTALNSAACGYEFKEDVTYFVVANDGLKYRFQTTSCTYNSSVDRADRQMNMLGEPVHEFVDMGEGMPERK